LKARKPEPIAPIEKRTNGQDFRHDRLGGVTTRQRHSPALFREPGRIGLASGLLLIQGRLQAVGK
jgi:hypothetical protein